MRVRVLDVTPNAESGDNAKDIGSFVGGSRGGRADATRGSGPLTSTGRPTRARASRARVWPRYRAYRWYIVLNFSARVVPAPSLRVGLVLEESSRLRGAASHFALGSMGPGMPHSLFPPTGL